VKAGDGASAQKLHEVARTAHRECASAAPEALKALKVSGTFAPAHPLPIEGVWHLQRTFNRGSTRKPDWACDASVGRGGGMIRSKVSDRRCLAPSTAFDGQAGLVTR
jgi:hypothetical protein